MIAITNFPLDLWHPIYFTQATSSIGNLVGMAADTLTGGNRAKLVLFVECPDDTVLPPSITVFHKAKQTICAIEAVEGDIAQGQGGLCRHLRPGVVTNNNRIRAGVKHRHGGGTSLYGGEYNQEANLSAQIRLNKELRQQW